jgi:hypothetical protein
MKIKTFLTNLNKLQLTAIFVAIFLFLGVINTGLSNYYLGKILDSIESSENIMENANEGLKQELSNIDEYKIVERVKNISSEARSELIIENYRLKSINVNLMGTEFKPAIQAFTDHSNAWVNWYERLESCTTRDCLLREIDKPNEITPTFRIAEEAFQQVIPIIDLVNAERRIADEFRD